MVIKVDQTKKETNSYLNPSSTVDNIRNICFNILKLYILSMQCFVCISYDSQNK
jgi:hypothetical protein